MAALTPADRLAIVETLNRYSHCLDHGRWDEFAALFTDDCVLDLSQVLGRYEGTAGVRAFAEVIRSAGVFMRHLVTNVVVEGDGERARAWAYVLAITGAPGTAQQSTGLYEDELVKQGDRWRLHRRRLALDLPNR